MDRKSSTLSLIWKLDHISRSMFSYSTAVTHIDFRTSYHATFLWQALVVKKNQWVFFVKLALHVLVEHFSFNSFHRWKIIPYTQKFCQNEHIICTMLSFVVLHTLKCSSWNILFPIRLDKASVLLMTSQRIARCIMGCSSFDHHCIFVLIAVYPIKYEHGFGLMCLLWFY